MEYGEREWKQNLTLEAVFSASKMEGGVVAAAAWGKVLRARVGAHDHLRGELLRREAEGRVAAAAA